MRNREHEADSVGTREDKRLLGYADKACEVAVVVLDAVF